MVRTVISSKGIIGPFFSRANNEWCTKFWNSRWICKQFIIVWRTVWMYHGACKMVLFHIECQQYLISSASISIIILLPCITTYMKKMAFHGLLILQIYRHVTFFFGDTWRTWYAIKLHKQLQNWNNTSVLHVWQFQLTCLHTCMTFLSGTMPFKWWLFWKCCLVFVFNLKINSKDINQNTNDKYFPPPPPKKVLLKCRDFFSIYYKWFK